MSQLSTEQMLEELKNFDTPSITNIVATYPTHPLCLGLYNPWTENWYTDTSIKCMYPELGRLVGYAVTCVYGLPDPNFSRAVLWRCRRRVRGFAGTHRACDAAELPADDREQGRSGGWQHGFGHEVDGLRGPHLQRSLA